MPWPDAPTNVSVPGSIQRGKAFSVTWGYTNDPSYFTAWYQTDASGGVLTGQLNGSIAGNARSGSFTIPAGAVGSTVRIVIQAYKTTGSPSGGSNQGFSAYVPLAAANTAPTVPGTPTVSPNPPVHGQVLTVSWPASTDAQGNLSGYSLERQYNGGSWAQVQANANRIFTETAQEAWTSVAYRVRAYDTDSAYSGYANSSTYTVSTPPPVISGSNTNLGIKTEGFAIDYTVTHPQGKSTTVTEKINGVTLRTFAAELGATQTFTLDGLDFMTLLNGPHTITITATDSSNITITRTYTFTKAVTKASITLETPLPADDMPTVCLLNVTGSIPDGADFTVEVCNNGFDDDPTWEDCTAKVLSGSKIFFANATKTATEWGFNFRVTADRNGAAGDGHIFSIGGNFE